METKNYLKWCPTKDIRFDGRDCTLKVEVSLDDDCKNKHCDFSITAMVYYKRPRPKEDRCAAGGCIHEIIAKHFPELKKFIPLHLCAHEGTPMYPEANGMFFLKEKGKEAAKDYLRCTDDEIEKLSFCGDDNLFFKYQLFSLGIVDRWKKEADEFIAFLEEKCGYKWVNPYTPEEERFRMVLTEVERNLVNERINSLYYSKENIERREWNRRFEERQKEYEKVWEEYAKITEKARVERDIKLCMLNFRLPIDNVIYYSFSNELVFNWKGFGDKISREDFDRFVAEADYSLLPDGIKIEFGKKK
jgi:hypothetical protein